MKFGLVGCGAVGVRRAHAMAPHHALVAACDHAESRASALADRFGGAVSTRWREVVAMELDALIVATPPDSHAEIACAALSQGIHVLVEKPAGRMAAETAAIRDAARRHRRQAKVGFNHRFHPALTAASELIAERRFGPPMLVRANYGHGGRPGYDQEWRFDPTIAGGGETVDQGSHLIDLARWYLGELDVAFAATPTWFWRSAVEDNCFLALRGADQRMAWLHASWTEWKNRFRLEIMCETGAILVDGLGGSYGTERLTTHRMLPEMGPPVTVTIEYPGPDRSWELEGAAFAASLEGAETSIADIEDALATARIVEAAYRYARP